MGIPDTTHIMPSSRFTWTRPTTHIYSYNREAQNILSERSRASSVTASASSSATMSRTARAASVVESGDTFKGYTGFYGKRLQEAMQTKGPTAAEAIYPSKGEPSQPQPQPQPQPQQPRPQPLKPRYLPHQPPLLRVRRPPPRRRRLP